MESDGQYAIQYVMWIRSKVWSTYLCWSNSIPEAQNSVNCGAMPKLLSEMPLHVWVVLGKVQIMSLYVAPPSSYLVPPTMELQWNDVPIAKRYLWRAVPSEVRRMANCWFLRVWTWCLQTLNSGMTVPGSWNSICILTSCCSFLRCFYWYNCNLIWTGSNGALHSVLMN